MKNSSKALAALTQAALALPTVAGAAGVQTDYLFNLYQEKDAPASQVVEGSRERYEIQSHLFRVVAPHGDQTLSVNLTYETMSGASPWYIRPDATTGKPLLVMSGASIKEERTAIRGTWSTPLLGGLTALSLGYSNEDDYSAISGGVEFEYGDEDKALTYSGGFGFSSDTIEPVEGLRSPEVGGKDDKTSLNVYGGVSYVLNPATVVQGSVSYQWHDGYLDDPYKRAWITSIPNFVRDSRPDGRQAWAFNAKLRHHVANANAAVHVDYRFFRDDWEIEAHTLEVAWHQVLADSWRVSPALRWYSQSQAFFYAPFYENARSDGFASSDYRLSPFGAISARVDVIKTLGDALSLGGGVEFYKADADYALKSVDVANPGLIEYLGYTARLTYRF